MIKRIMLVAIIVLFLLSESLAFSPPVFIGGSTISCDADYCQDFEGAGAPTDWSSTLGDFDASTSGLELEKSECLEMLDTDGTVSANYDPSYNEDDYYWTFWNRTTAVLSPAEGDEYIFYVRDSTDALLAWVREQDDDNHIECKALGGALADTEYTRVANTTTKYRVRYQQGSDPNTDSRIDVWIWNGSSWGNQCTSSNGNVYTAIDNIRLYKSAAGTNDSYFDYFKGSTTEITDPD